MNETLKLLYNRKSLRSFADRRVPEEKVDMILGAVRYAPTAGSMALYSVIRVKDQNLKDTLAKTCDNQPFIAQAPVVLLFLADCQRLYDYLDYSGAAEYAAKTGKEFATPDEGFLMLACQDAMIAAHTSVLAAESMGLGSCYIGDIMENYEEHRKIFNLPDFVFPLSLVVAGYSRGDYYNRRPTPKVDREKLFFEDTYHRLSSEELADLYAPVEKRYYKDGSFESGGENYGQDLFARKYTADYAAEMARSVKAAMKVWQG